MHPAPTFLETDREVLLDRIERWPFALVIGVENGRAHSAHAPVIADDAGALHFHLARSNPAAKAIAAAGQALIVFTGPHDYISPDWYGLDNQVPTWNYLSVEAEGPITLHAKPEARTLLDTLSMHFETRLSPKPVWRTDKMDQAALDRMISAIQAFSMTPFRFEGITKIGQNKPADVRKRAGNALKAAGGDTTLAAMMERDQ